MLKLPNFDYSARWAHIPWRATASSTAPTASTSSTTSATTTHLARYQQKIWHSNIQRAASRAVDSRGDTVGGHRKERFSLIIIFFLFFYYYFVLFPVFAHCCTPYEYIILYRKIIIIIGLYLLNVLDMMRRKQIVGFIDLYVDRAYACMQALQSYTSCESPLLYIVHNRLRSYMAYVVRRPAIHSSKSKGKGNLFFVFKFVGFALWLSFLQPLLDPCDVPYFFSPYSPPRRNK